MAACDVPSVAATHRSARACRAFAFLLAAAGVPLDSSPSAFAADAVASLADARVRYDDARWTVLSSEQAIRFEPRGENARRLDPVEIKVRYGERDCARLAELAFASGLYDTRALTGTPVRVGGMAAIRYSARTGCRNATPIGVVSCVLRRDRAYILQAVQSGCGGRNLFSGIDPVAEIVDGTTFVAAAP